MPVAEPARELGRQKGVLQHILSSLTRPQEA